MLHVLCIRGSTINLGMGPSKHCEPVDPVMKAPAPQRPNTLFHRLSSGLSHALPSFRSSTPKNEQITRPATAPSAAGTRPRRRAIAAESEQLLVPRNEMTTADELEQPCQYDPSSYYSFISIEKRRCSLCGMRGPKIVRNEPSHACRYGTTSSHISSNRTQANIDRRHSAVDAHHLAHLANSSSSVNLGPRPVTPERAAKRIGNPPRVSKLPPGIIRLPAANAVFANQDRYATMRPNSALGTTSPSGISRNVHLPSSYVIDKETLPKKPVSPKLHHIHGLSNSENFPFIHRHEIPKHAVALRAGSTSPLTDRSDSPKSPRGVHTPHDYSNTVYYGGKNSQIYASQAASPPHVTTVLVKEIQTSGNAVIDLRTSPLDITLDNSQVYRKASPQVMQRRRSLQVLVDTSESGTTFSSQETASTRIGDMRLELKGGSLFLEDLPRLRGGSSRAGSSFNLFSFKLKRWLLTCHGPCPDDFDTDSDADLPPARVVSAERVVRMQQKMNGRVSLPAHLARPAPTTSLTSPTSPGTEGIPPVTTFVTTIQGPPKRPSSKRFSSLSHPELFNRRPKSPINQPSPLTPSQVLIPPFPHLRGGAESPDSIPPTLFRLAGGTGRPISLTSWKQLRPRQILGGLLGMAVFGKHYGKVYGGGDNEEEVVFSCSASVKMSAGGISPLTEHRREVTAKTHDTAPAHGVEPMQRALIPPRMEPVDEVPLCSGALPVDLLADLPADSSVQPSSMHSKDTNAAAGARTDGHA